MRRDKGTELELLRVSLGYLQDCYSINPLYHSQTYLVYEENVERIKCLCYSVGRNPKNHNTLNFLIPVFIHKGATPKCICPDYVLWVYMALQLRLVTPMPSQLLMCFSASLQALVLPLPMPTTILLNFNFYHMGYLIQWD